jgi:protein phosphatase
MIPSDQPHLLIASQSHAGETGKNNEDAYSAGAYRLKGETTPSLLAVVADGIGGHQAGEIASKVAVASAVKALEASDGQRPVPQLRAAVVAAGRAVARAAEEAEDRTGMGSTIAVVWVIGRQLYTANVGDSRIYLMRGGVLRQLTIDHTWIQEALENRIITPAEARGHPHAHVLRRYLGGSLDVEPDLRMQWNPGDDDVRAAARQGLRLAPGDQILLCTDGLTDLVDSGEIAEALGAGGPQEAVESLVILARARGGHDNITLVLLSVPHAAARAARSRVSPSAMAAATVALVILVLAGMAAAWWLGLWPWR